MTERVIFLDIDGVILAGRHWKAERRERLPADTIAMLNEICERSGAMVVISSTWRRDRDLRGRLRQAGFTGRFHHDWRTPVTDCIIPGTHLIKGTCRGDEIADWLRRNEPATYCIIDDDSDMRPEQKASFIKTEFQEGLCGSHVERAVAILAATTTSTTDT